MFLRVPAEPRGPRPGFENSAWFRLNVGRRNNADPKWLLPLICRHGNVTRKDIGVIRIFDEETAFEVSLAAADRFRKAARKADGEVILEPLPAGPAAGHAERPARGRPVRGRSDQNKPHQDKTPYEKPSRGKAFRDAPAQGKSDDGKAERGKAAFEKPREAKAPGQGKGERQPKGRRAGAFEGKSRGKRTKRS